MMFQAGIVCFSVIDVVPQDGTRRRTPRLRVIGNDMLAGTILVLNFQLRQQGKLSSVRISLPSPKPNSSAEPAIPQDRADGILTFLQHSGDIECLIAQVLVIDRPA